METVERILIIKLRQIGDVLLAVPTIRAVRERYPVATIAVCVASGTEEMLTGNPLLNEVIVFDREGKGENVFGRIWREICFVFALRARGFDMTIDLTSGDRAAILSFLSGARFRIAADPGRSGFWGKRTFYTHRSLVQKSRRHMVEQNLEVVRPWGMDTQDKSVFLSVRNEDEKYVDGLFAEHSIPKDEIKIHIHPTSHWLFKCWRDDYMAALIDRLWEFYGARMLLTCGPNFLEAEKAQRIIDLARFKPISFIGKTTLKQLAAISARCHLFIGVDSAPMHIAAAMGTPVVAIFGPSGEFHWGPWGEGHQVVAKQMACRPCGQAGCNNSKRSECLETLTVEEVWQAVANQIQQLFHREPLIHQPLGFDNLSN